MEIRGRTVEAVRYGGKQIYTVHIKHKDGDCRRKKDPQYKCLENCEDSIIVARVMDVAPVSVKALVPEEVKIGVWSPDTNGITTLEGMEDLVRRIQGYRLIDVKKNKVLYFMDMKIGHYTPCGLATDINLFGEEIYQTMSELVRRIKEVHAIAKDVPIEALVQDKSLANTINNPIVSQFARLFGKDMEELVRVLRQAKNQEN